MAKLSIGISDYKVLIEKECYYVDKTLFIKEILENPNSVNLICRPRRFGKTLNLSMLNYFFNCTGDNKHLFEGKDISNYKKYMDDQGAFPVIFLSLKGVKELSWDMAYQNLVNIIGIEFRRHQVNIINSLTSFEQKLYNSICDNTASVAQYRNSLQFLSRALALHYKKRVVILIDEYDTPIESGYEHGYYHDIINFIRGFFTDALKGNDEYLQLAVLTGVLRTSKESVFSDLNNCTVNGVMSDFFADKFGLTQNEVNALFKDNLVDVDEATIKEWYNGYCIGTNNFVYNPWSILNCAIHKGKLEPYWVNTSRNVLIKKLLITSSVNFKSDFEQLLEGNTLEKSVDEGFVFYGIERDESAIWSLFLFAGYLTYTGFRYDGKGKYTCDLVIPNKEILGMFYKLIEEIASQPLSSSTVEIMFKAILRGDGNEFGAYLQEFISNSMSYYDISELEPERSYHLFILGLLVILEPSYSIRSNRESGFGRYDIMLIPKNKNGTGIVIEFKKSTDLDKLKESAIDALAQIKNRNYCQELRSQGIENIIGYGVACMGKHVIVASEKL